MLQRSEIRLADRILYAYARHDETLIVPSCILQVN